MNFAKGCVYAVVVFFLVCASSYVSKAAEDHQYESGKHLYKEKCQLCHGINGKGNGPAASAFDPPPADFTSPEFWAKTTSQKIDQAILKGKGEMPAFDFTPEELKDVKAYITKAFKDKSDHKSTSDQNMVNSQANRTPVIE